MKTYKNYDFHKKIKLLQIMQISNIFSTNKLYYFIFGSSAVLLDGLSAT